MCPVWLVFYSAPFDERLKRSARRRPVAFSFCSLMVARTAESRLEKSGWVLKKARSSPLRVRHGRGGTALALAVHALGVQLRVGVHTGEGAIEQP